MKNLGDRIADAIKYRKNDGPLKLRKDIINAPRHVFGNHSHCESYYCTGESDDQNYIPEFHRSGILFKIMETTNNLALHAKSLFFHANKNTVEQLNSVITKHI